MVAIWGFAMKRLQFAMLLPLVAAVGCGGGGGGTSEKKSTTTTPPLTTPPPVNTPPPLPPGTFAVASFSPKNGPATTPELTVVFSEAVDGNTLDQGKTWVVAEDDDTNP